MNRREREYLSQHLAHDVDQLIRRWEVLAEQTGLELCEICRIAEYPVHALASNAEFTRRDGLYLSAGVHGDEPAGVWALLEWAERHRGFLRRRPVLIFPCFNPWGLVNNVRHDDRGRDLNRLFHNRTLPLFKSWRAMMEGKEFALALHLHEDYDACGIYAYELGEMDQCIAGPALAACRNIIPIEPTGAADGRPLMEGLIRQTEGLHVHKLVEEELEGAYPEAIYVYLHHARATITFESPSEFSFWHRVRVQKAFIKAAISQVDGLR